MILHHPRVPDVTVDVPDSDVAAWTEQGWTKSESKAVRKAAADNEKPLSKAPSKP